MDASPFLRGECVFLATQRCPLGTPHAACPNLGIWFLVVPCGKEKNLYIHRLLV